MILEELPEVVPESNSFCKDEAKIHLVTHFVFSCLHLRIVQEFCSTFAMYQISRILTGTDRIFSFRPENR